jgi:multidrug efflux pump
MRHAMGVAVFFGMLGVTLFGLVLTPVFYVLLRRLAGAVKSPASAAAPTEHGHRPVMASAADR